MFKDCEESEEGLVKKISINQWQLEEDITSEMTSEDGEKIKRIVYSNIQFLPGSHFVKRDGVNEEVSFFPLPTASTGVLFDCEGRTDVYVKNVNLKFKIKPVKEGFLIEENDTLTHRQVSEGIQNVGNAGSMQVSEEIQNVEDAGQVSEGIQNVESYRI